ncbi:MAG: ABC transporter permease [Vicinamibacterales bacterium]|nr:ABC transporter permease [Vicinamibacterales bacterium]
MRRLTRASLRFYAATNAMVVLGVAVAVAVLAGALLVGSSVRDSLRELALSRLGATDLVVSSPTFFRAALADEVTARSSPALRSAAPMIVFDGAVVHDESKRVAGRVAVYGIDERFGRFHGIDGHGATGREALLSPALAAELGARAGDTVTLRVARPSDIPLATLQGRRETTGERIRLNVARVLDQSALGEFSLSPSQGPVLAIYVPMARLQRDLGLGEHVNVMLIGVNEPVQDAAKLVRDVIAPVATLDDLGLRARETPGGETSIESRAGFLTKELAAEVERIAARGGRTVTPVLTYVANTIRIGHREIPYSTVTAIDVTGLTPVRQPQEGVASTAGRHAPVWLNEWAAADLAAKLGDEVTLEYYVWADDDGLETRTATLSFRGVVPMTGVGGDRTLTPDYPGISDAADMTSWDPPFPVELKRIRPKDEEYWDAWRAAPKAIVPLAEGQRIWGSRFGNVSSLRLSGRAPIGAQDIDPAVAGVSARSVRDAAAAAAEGTTDFGEYFLYFSFFLVVSALLLAYLFFAVGLEQRTREVGLLAAVGFSPAAIRASFVREGFVLAGIGAIIGAAAAVGYGALIMYGLRTWWVGAVGTTRLELHVAPASLAAGVIGAFAAGLLALWLGVGAMSRRSARALLTGDVEAGLPPSRAALPPSRYALRRTGRRTSQTRLSRKGTRGASWWIAMALAAIGIALIAASSTGAIDQTAGFFGAGGAWLVAGLCAASVLLRRPRVSGALTQGFAGIAKLGFRHTAARPARSVFSLALIAFACFVLVSVGAFRKDSSGLSLEKTSGTGGYPLIAESVAPLMFDPNTAEGRDGLGIETADPILNETRITRFRLRPGDETSCLTLYKPANPRIIAPEPRFYEEPRFSFAASMAATAEEQANPWRLLSHQFDDGAVPAIADQTTLMYVLHLGIGDDFVLNPGGASPVHLRIVGALADSMLQSELIIGETDFVRLFPRDEGYRVWLIDAPPERAAEVTTHLEDRLSDFGLDVSDTRERWASYHEVENTYLATFQALGSLGLLLGTVGLGAVLARNVLERRREIGLLKAVGFSHGDVRAMVLSESLALVGGGLLLGAVSAIVAVLPALRDRAQSMPIGALVVLLTAVAVTGIVASLFAVRIANSTPVLTALKSE